MSRYLGVDLGGTNIKTAVVDVTGDARSVVATSTVATLGELGPAGVMARLGEVGRTALVTAGAVDAAGVGVPGLFDTEAGSIVLFSNLPGEWAGVPVREPLATAWSMPVAMINDARAMTLAETRMGAAAGCDTVIALALGTGIGGGVVVEGQLRYGPNGRAGEVGHQVLQVDGPLCGAGCRGCLESLAAAGVLARLAGAATAADAVLAAAAGDERARAAIRVTARHIGHALANLVTVLHPDRIVIGGGVAAAGEELLGPIRDAVAELAVLVPRAAYDIVPATLGPYAGAIGAALWAGEAGKT